MAVTNYSTIYTAHSTLASVKIYCLAHCRYYDSRTSGSILVVINVPDLSAATVQKQSPKVVAEAYQKIFANELWILRMAPLW